MVSKAVLTRMDVYYHCVSWQENVEKALQYFKGVQLKAREGKIAFDVAVNSIWQERNLRAGEVIVKDIENYVSAKACIWQVSRKYNNWSVCKSWGIRARALVRECL